MKICLLDGYISQLDQDMTEHMDIIHKKCGNGGKLQ